MPRSVLVTGAADGIGRAIATSFAQAGDSVGLLDYDADKLERTTAVLRTSGATVEALPTDVRDAAAVDARYSTWSRRTTDSTSPSTMPPSIPTRRLSKWTKRSGTAASTPTSRAPFFSRAPRPGTWCARVAAARYALFPAARTNPRGAAQPTTARRKTGLVLLAQTLALELAEHRINVNVIWPGFIEVGLRPGVSLTYRDTIKHDIPWGRFGEPSEVARAVQFVCSADAEFMTGSVLDIDGGSSAGRFHLPISSTPVQR